MWKILKADGYPAKRELKFGKKHERLVANVLANLKQYADTVSFSTPELAKRTLSFVHDEKKGLVAIDQRPPKGGVQLRLYVYPQHSSKFLHVIAFGDKSSQGDDIRFCHRYIQEIENGKKG